MGGAFNEIKKPNLSNLEIVYLMRFPIYVAQSFYFHFFSLKFPSYERFSMTSQFDLNRFYDIIIRNSAFQLGNSRSYIILL